MSHQPFGAADSLASAGRFEISKEYWYTYQPVYGYQWLQVLTRYRHAGIGLAAASARAHQKQCWMSDMSENTQHVNAVQALMGHSNRGRAIATG